MISFGRKIPLYQCKIYDKKDCDDTKSTVSLLTCSSKKDVDYIKNQKESDWLFYDCFLDSAQRQYKTSRIAKCPNDSNEKIYIIQDDKNKLAGACLTYFFKNTANVLYIETQNQKYSHGGKALLAALSKECIKKDVDFIEIKKPINIAKRFYLEICGFTPKKGSNSYVMDKEGMKELISRTEEKTGKLSCLA